jgi:hypothetical protein
MAGHVMVTQSNESQPSLSHIRDSFRRHGTLKRFLIAGIPLIISGALWAILNDLTARLGFRRSQRRGLRLPAWAASVRSLCQLAPEGCRRTCEKMLLPTAVARQRSEVMSRRIAGVLLLPLLTGAVLSGLAFISWRFPGALADNPIAFWLLFYAGLLLFIASTPMRHFVLALFSRRRARRLRRDEQDLTAQMLMLLAASWSGVATVVLFSTSTARWWIPITLGVAVMSYMCLMALPVAILVDLLAKLFAPRLPGHLAGFLLGKLLETLEVVQNQDKWPDVASRARCVKHLNEIASAIQLGLPALMRTGEPRHDGWTQTKAERIALGFQVMQRSLVSPRSTTRQWLVSQIAVAVHSIAIGAWDQLPCEEHTEYVVEKRIVLRQAARALRMILQGTLPLLGLWVITERYPNTVTPYWLTTTCTFWLVLHLIAVFEFSATSRLEATKLFVDALLPRGRRNE